MSSNPNPKRPSPSTLQQLEAEIDEDDSYDEQN